MKVNRELSDILIERRDTSKECPYFLYRAFRKRSAFFNKIFQEEKNMKNSTALGASSEATRTITFKSAAHKNFYLEYLPKCRYQDVYHRALIYCLGIDEDTRNHVNRIYDFKSGCVKTE